MTPYYHAVSSSKKFGGEPDFLEKRTELIDSFIDDTLAQVE